MRALLLLLLMTSSSQAAVQCLFEESSNIITPNRHCEDDCRDWERKQPVEQLAISMPEEWIEKGAFFQMATSRCEGNGCPWASLGAPQVFNSGKSVRVTYKTWGIPTTMVLSAKVCLVN